MANLSTTFFSTERNQKTIAYYLAFIGLGMVDATLGPTLGELAAKTGTDKGEIGVLLTIRAMAYLLGSLAAGWLYDRYTGHRIIGLAVLVLVSMFLVLPTVPYLWVLMAVFFIIGIGAAGLDVGGNTLLLWTHGDKVGPFMNGLHFFFGVGAFLAPIVVAQSLSFTDGISWAYWVIGVLLIPLAFMFSRISSPQSVGTVRIEGSDKGDTNYWLVGMAVLLIILYVGVELGFGNWLYTYAVERDLLNKTDAAYLTSAFWGAFTFGRLLGIPVAARLRPRSILLGSLIGAVISTIFMVAFQEVTFLWIGTLAFGFSIAPIFPTMLTFVERRTHMTGQITSLFFVGAGAGAMVIPWSIGALMDSQGDEIMLWLVAGYAVVMLAVFLVMMVMFFRPSQVTQTSVVAD